MNVIEQSRKASRRVYGALLVAVVVALPGVGAADPGPLDLRPIPPILSTQVDPNIAVTVDDSGSMGFGFTPDAVDNSACYYRYYRYYSSDYNKQYYDPTQTYTPPINADGTSMANQSWASAAVNVFHGTGGNVDLGSNYFVSWWEEQYNNDDLNRIHYASSGSDSTTTCEANNQEKFMTFPAGGGGGFYCTHVGGNLTDNANYTCQAVPVAQRTNFANWFSYYRIRGFAAATAATRAFAQVSPSVRVAWQNMNNNEFDGTTDFGNIELDEDNPGDATNRRNRFWEFLMSSPLSGNTPTRRSTIRASALFERTGAAATNPYYDVTLGRELSCRQNFHMLITDGYWNEENPAVVTAAQDDENFNGNLPDGTPYKGANADHSSIFWNESAASTNAQRNCENWVHWNDDNNSPNDRNQSCFPSLADIAFHYWRRDLRDNLTNNVPPSYEDLSTGVTGDPVADVSDPADIPEIYFNPANDPATWQHVVQYFVGFGVDGSISFSEETLEDLRTGDIAWPYPQNNSSRAVDDSWHAAVNARGQYFSASNPTELVDALAALLNNISRRQASTTSPAVSSNVSVPGAFAYATGFDSASWGGNLAAFRFNADATLAATPEWDAGCMLTGGECRSTGSNAGAARNPSSRVVFTAESMAGPRTDFTWASLPTAHQALLNDNPETVAFDNDGRGEQRVNYLRGDRTAESASPNLRPRSSVLGAIVNSTPRFEWFPVVRDRSWPEGSVEATEAAQEARIAFMQSNRARTPVVYVGANDGMLHAFNAATGVELWGYIPFQVFPNLAKFTNPRQGPIAFVDESPVVENVYFNGSWRSMLVGALRLGGRGVFALDVTNPSAPAVLWEFGASLGDLGAAGNASNLGYTFGEPRIGRIRAGNKWVVVVASGYFKSGENVDAEDNDFSSIFVLDAQTGTLLKELRTDPELNESFGLASPVFADYYSDGIEDAVIAGDLVGNLWRFDISSDDSTEWSVDLMYKPATNEAEPITAMPRLFAKPDLDGLVVTVGTGRYLTGDDRVRSGYPTQRVLGVHDYISSADRVAHYPLELDDLYEYEVTTTAGRRYLNEAEGATDSGHGYHFELPLEGERIVAAAAAEFTSGIAVMQTLIPAGDDPCSPGLGGALLVFDGAAGKFSTTCRNSLGQEVPCPISNGACDPAVSQCSVSLKPPAVVIKEGGGGLQIVRPPQLGNPDDPEETIDPVNELPDEIGTPMWARRAWRETGKD